MATPNIETVKKGDKVTTIHGEKLTVLDVKMIPIVRNGQPTGKMMTMILAESGGHNTWFPVVKIKEEESK